MLFITAHDRQIMREDRPTAMRGGQDKFPQVVCFVVGKFPRWGSPEMEIIRDNSIPYLFAVSIMYGLDF